MGEQLIEHVDERLWGDETSLCYISDAAESQQRDFTTHILSRRVKGKLVLSAIDLAQIDSKTAEAQAASFNASMEKIYSMMEERGRGTEAELLRRFHKQLVTCTQNDRAAPARAAARMVVGAEFGDNDPTCAEHALANILEEGRKAMDIILRELMNITDEQAAGDAEKIKALRTCVGWMSSPACALIYQVLYICVCII